jgi:hypothetical protein
MLALRPTMSEASAGYSLTGGISDMRRLLTLPHHPVALFASLCFLFALPCYLP